MALASGTLGRILAGSWSEHARELLRVYRAG